MRVSFAPVVVADRRLRVLEPAAVVDKGYVGDGGSGQGDLLAATEPYLSETFAIPLRVITSASWASVIGAPGVVPERFRVTWPGCMGGAVPEADYLDLVGKAGAAEIEVVARHALGGDELDALARCPGPEFAPAVVPDDLAPVQGKVVSIKFTARKPT